MQRAAPISTERGCALAAKSTLPMAASKFTSTTASASAALPVEDSLTLGILGLVAFRASVAMPMPSTAMATFDKAIRPRAGGRDLAFLFGVWRGAWQWRIGALILAKLLGDEGTPLRFVEFNAAVYFTCFKIAKNFADCHKCKCEVAGCPFHH
eukprot:2256461-Pleurochrysis_carterae.AAC.4